MRIRGGGQEQGRDRAGRAGDRRGARASRRPPARDEARAARGTVSARDDSPGVDTEARRRRAWPRHTERGRPGRTAGRAPGARSKLRTDLPRREPRFSAWTQLSHGSGGGQAASVRRVWVGGGPGPGEILRPGPPRAVAGAARAAGQGPATRDVDQADAEGEGGDARRGGGSDG